MVAGGMSKKFTDRGKKIPAYSKSCKIFTNCTKKLLNLIKAFCLNKNCVKNLLMALILICFQLLNYIKYLNIHFSLLSYFGFKH